MYKIDYRYLRPKKAEALRKWIDAPLEVREDLEVWQGSHATVLPLRKREGLLFGMGGVMDSNGEYVPLSAIPNRVEGSYPYEHAEYRDERVVYCGYLIRQWGHFLIEGAARLWYFLENDPTIDKYVFFVEENASLEISGNFREFLELLGVWDKLELVNQPTAFREVLIPELGYRMLDYYSPKYRSIFTRVGDNAPMDPAWKPIKKICYSRSQLMKAKPFEFGFDVLDNFFEKNGYTLLYPEKVPLSQMIFYIRNCDVLATPSGSLQLNMLFGHQGQKLEILERFLLNDDNQADINRLKELDVTYIDVNIPLYPVDFTGPYMVGYNDNFQRFAEDHHYCPPDKKYCTEKYRRECFVRYFKSYQDLYRYRWFMSDWYMPFTDYLYEGYLAGYDYFKEYLNGSRPFLWHHYFEVHYWKQFIKRILRRNARG